MSLRFRVERAEEGAVADPSPTNLNENELAAEINGYLDRHNLIAQGVGAASINVGTFTTLGSDFSVADLVLDLTTTAPQTVHDVTITVTQDCQIEVDWSGTWTTTVTSTPLADCCIFDLSINGRSVATTGPIYLGYDSNSTSLNGSLPVQAGTVELRVSVTLVSVGGFYGAGTDTASTSIFQVAGPVQSPTTIKERELVYEVRTR